ncbi:MAG: pyridoxal-phosphate dependent enzyme [Flavobacterium sp.]
MEVLTQEIPIANSSIKLFIRREDLIHPFVSGNKFRKLKYNLEQAQKEKHHCLLTFGGAFSNHIAATAFAGKENGFETIGVIRGEELASKIQENPTLKFAHDCGMKFEFVSREKYKTKSSEEFITELAQKFGSFYLIPEGGTNDLAVKGCKEILIDKDSDYNFICCSVGTGGTIAGLINSSFSHQKILGFPSLKGEFIKEDICKFVTNNNWDIIEMYHFGGYAKVNEELIVFMNNFYNKHGILLDPIYTGKMVFGVLDLISKNYFPIDSKILLIHTGGIQGIEGMNLKLKSKNLQTIQTND